MSRERISLHTGSGARDPNPARVCLYFSPHLDDAVLSCGGSIAAQVAAGARVTVVTVFAGGPPQDGLTQLAARRHRSMWPSVKDLIGARRKEDLAAVEILGCEALHWDWSEAMYRLMPDGSPAYPSLKSLYEGMREGEVIHFEDICRRVSDFVVTRGGRGTELYFPLGLGGHADHVWIHQVGRRMMRRAYDVRFYEDVPYAWHTRLTQDSAPRGMKCTAGPIDMETKVRAVACYAIGGVAMGPSRERAQRLRSYATRVAGGKGFAERFWFACDEKPFSGCREVFESPRDWLAKGQGVCLDVGCGDGRHQNVVESLGYRWVGLEAAWMGTSPSALGDGGALPMRAECTDAVLLWHVLHHVSHPLKVLREARRVLKKRGWLYGNTSFLEPFQSRSRYGFSPMGLRGLLREAGFTQIEIIPGVSGPELIAWTLVGRAFGSRAAGAGLFLMRAWMGLARGLYLAVSAFRRILKFGGTHGPSLAARFPWDFAGHVLFKAQKDDA